MDVRKKLVDVFTHLGKHIRNGDEYGICYTSDFTEAVEEVLKMLKNGVTVQEWISVEDRLPKIFCGVLVYCPKNKNVYEVYLNARGDWHFFDTSVAGAVLHDDVTHWMPLPLPPNTEVVHDG